MNLLAPANAISRSALFFQSLFPGLKTVEKKDEVESPALSQDLVVYLKDLMEAKTMRWKQTNAKKENHAQELTMHHGGTYQEMHCGYEKEGTWCIEVRKQRIHFTVLRFHHERVSGGKQQQICMLKSYQKDRLVLCWYGPKGCKEMIYQPM